MDNGSPTATSLRLPFDSEDAGDGDSAIAVFPAGVRPPVDFELRNDAVHAFAGIHPATAEQIREWSQRLQIPEIAFHSYASVSRCLSSLRKKTKCSLKIVGTVQLSDSGRPT